MTDAENSDDERYANESFENESDTEVPEMTEFEIETSESSEGGEEEEEDDLSSVKLNTGPIKINSFSNSFTAIQKTDVVPFASSSDEEDDVIVGQTLAEINTPSMLFEDEHQPTPAPRHFIINENNHHLKTMEKDTHESSEEISEEEDDDDEEEEFKRIQDMEERYLQQNSATISKEIINRNTKMSETKEENNTENEPETNEQESENENEVEAVEEQESEIDDKNTIPAKETFEDNEEYSRSDNSTEVIYRSETQTKLKNSTIQSIDQNHLMQFIQTSLTNLKITSSTDKEESIAKSSRGMPKDENAAQTVDVSNILNRETIALAVVNALKSTGITNLQSLVKKEESQKQTKELQKHQYNEHSRKPAIEPNYQSVKEQEIEIVQYKDDYKGEMEDEIEEIQNGHDPDDDNVYYDDDRDVYYDAHFDYRITSKTPTSFNSDDYIFHANFIKHFHRTNSTDKLRVKPHPRKSMSFSNERMREIERHNQILLRKILTQKPTYTLKSKSSQSSVQKLPSSQSNTRLTTSAVNRKKQQRQIDLDNQVLKRKIEAIAMRSRPLIS